MEDVWVCRLCGHVDPTDTKLSRCPSCGNYMGLVRASRDDAEKIARRRWRRRLIRRVCTLGVAVLLVGGVTFWLLRFFLEWGPNPPGATTQISVRLAPNTWAQSRRTPQNTGFTPEAPPTSHRIRWTYRTSKALHASPAVAGAHVYLTTEDGRTLALDRETGAEQWAYVSGSLSASTPSVAADLLIFTIRPGRVIALDRHTGERRWQTDLGHPIMALISPLVVQGSVYIGAADHKLYALDAATGRQRWAFATKDWILSTAAYTATDDRVIVASKDSLVYVVGAKTGRQRLAYPTGWGLHGGAGVAIEGERAYFGSSGGRVSAMAWQNRTYPWEKPLRLWRGRLYMWGVLKSAPEQTGRVWSTRIGGEVVHPPAIAHQAVYAVTVERGVASLAADTGTVRWQIELDVDITAAPTVAGHMVLVGTETGVIGLEAHSGAHRWIFRTGGKVTGSPIVAGDTIYVASHDGVLYAVTASEPK